MDGAQRLFVSPLSCDYLLIFLPLIHLQTNGVEKISQLVMNIDSDCMLKRVATDGAPVISYGVFTLPDTDAETDTDAIGLETHCVGVGKGKICVGVGQCERTINW